MLILRRLQHIRATWNSFLKTQNSAAKEKFLLAKILLIFTALHACNAVYPQKSCLSLCMSGCPSVCLSKALFVTKQEEVVLPFLYHIKDHFSHSFMTKRMVGCGDPST